MEKQKIRIIQMLSKPDYYLLHSNNDKFDNYCIFMTYLTKEEENNIDKIGERQLAIKRGDKKFYVSKKSIIAYGEIDFTKNSTDLKTISNYKWFKNLGFKGKKIYTHYDYDTHTCSSQYKYPLWSETWNPADVVKFAHGCLNKPERCLIFKYTR